MFLPSGALNPDTKGQLDLEIPPSQSFCRRISVHSDGNPCHAENPPDIHLPFDRRKPCDG